VDTTLDNNKQREVGGPSSDLHRILCSRRNHLEKCIELSNCWQEVVLIFGYYLGWRTWFSSQI